MMERKQAPTQKEAGGVVSVFKKLISTFRPKNRMKVMIL
jgi:hypothetical protein